MTHLLLQVSPYENCLMLGSLAPSAGKMTPIHQQRVCGEHEKVHFSFSLVGCDEICNIIYSDSFGLSELIKISHKRHLPFNYTINWLINQYTVFTINIEVFMSDLR